MAILSDDQVEAIHHASLQVLRDIGVNFLLPEARDILAAAGAKATLSVATLFVIVGDQLIKQPHAPAGTALGHRWLVLR